MKLAAADFFNTPPEKPIAAKGAGRTCNQDTKKIRNFSLGVSPIWRGQFRSVGGSFRFW